MTRDELLATLRRLSESPASTDQTHMQADNALLAFINDDEISEAFLAIRRYYA